jgi:hypothetical protein
VEYPGAFCHDLYAFVESVAHTVLDVGAACGVGADTPVDVELEPVEPTGLGADVQATSTRARANRTAKAVYLRMTTPFKIRSASVYSVDAKTRAARPKPPGATTAR